MKNVLKTVLLLTLCAALLFAAACNDETTTVTPEPGSTSVEPGTPENPTTPDEPTVPEYDYSSALDPVSAALPTDKEVKILVWGDYTVGGNNMSGTLGELAQAGGYTSTITTYFYDNTAKNDTYNLYELYNFDGTTIGSIKDSGTAQKVSAKLAEGVDYFVVVSGRDKTLYNESSAEKNIAAAKALEAQMQAVNPDAKMVLVAGPAYLGGFDKLGVSSSLEHLKKINEYADKMAGELNGAIIARVGNAIMLAKDKGCDVYSETFANQPSEAGSYLTATVLYSRIFGQSPAGLATQTALDSSVTAQLQAVASQSALGIMLGLSDIYDYTVPADAVTPELSNENEVKILLWGDYVIGGSSMSDTLKSFAASAGYSATLTTYYYNNYGKDSTYNLYELFEFDGNTLTGMKTSGTAQKVNDKLAEGIDFFVFISGRDKALYNEVVAEKNIAAAKAVEEKMLAVNPNAKMVVFAAPAFTQGLDKFGAQNVVEHLVQINAYADKVASNLSSAIVARVGNAFMLATDKGCSVYDQNDPNMPSGEGSCVTAAVLFSRIFGKSPVGLAALSTVDGDRLALIEEIVAQSAMGIYPSETPLVPDIPYVPDTPYVPDIPDTPYVEPDDSGSSVVEPVEEEEIDTTDYSVYDYKTPMDKGTEIQLKGKSYNAIMWGDYTIIGNSLASTLKQLAAAGGYNLKVTAYGYNNYKSSTYNLYELFSYSDYYHATGWTNGSTTSKIRRKLEEDSAKVDFLIVNSGRDRSILNESGMGRTVTAAQELEKQLHKNNPDGKYIIYAPMPYPEGQGTTTKIFDATMVTNKHLCKINEFADRMASSLVSPIVARVGNAFRMADEQGLPVYDDTYRVQPSAEGAYLEACIFYARMFGVSPVGVEYYGNISEETAKKLQLVAQESVFGKNYKMPEVGVYTPDAEALQPKPAPLPTTRNHSVYLVGDYVLSSNMANILNNFASADGYDASIKANSYESHDRETITYSLYEMFTWESDNKTIVSWTTSARAKAVRTCSADYLVLVSGRDRTLNNETSAVKQIVAAQEIEKQYLKNNPNGKIVLVLSQSLQTGFSSYSGTASTTEEFNEEIIDFAERLAKSLTKKPILAYVGSTYEQAKLDGVTGLYMNDSSKFQSELGDYAAACAIYSAIFGKTAVGMPGISGVDSNTIRTIQKASHKVTFNEEAIGVHSGATRVLYATDRTLKDNNTAEMIQSIAEKAGFALDLTVIAGESNISGYANSNAIKKLLDYDLDKFDTIIVEAGRDDVLYDKDAKKLEMDALLSLEKQLISKNEEGKLVIVAPFARQNTKGYNFKTVSSKTGIKTASEYSKLIQDYAQELCDTLTNSSFIVNVAKAFDKATAAGLNPYASVTSDYASDVGSYIVANTVLSRLLQSSTLNTPYYGNLSEKTAKTAQQIVYDTVFGL